VVSALEARLATLWVDAAGDPRTPIRWPGVVFTPPVGDGAAWLEPVVVFGEGLHLSKDGRNRIVGVLNVNLFASPGGGLGSLYTLADQVRDLFNRVDLPDLRLQVPSGPRLVTEDPFLQLALTVPFEAEEVVP
jgi:hypothetical protein